MNPAPTKTPTILSAAIIIMTDKTHDPFGFVGRRVTFGNMGA